MSVRILKSMTVNQVIMQYPALIPVFNEFNIDSCCGGSDTIEEAAKKNGIDEGKIMRELNNRIEE